MKAKGWGIGQFHVGRAKASRGAAGTAAVARVAVIYTDNCRKGQQQEGQQQGQQEGQQQGQQHRDQKLQKGQLQQYHSAV